MTKKATGAIELEMCTHSIVIRRMTSTNGVERITSTAKDKDVRRSNMRADRVNRLPIEPRKNKSAAMHPVWRFFRVYARQEYKNCFMCKVCHAAGQHHNAEVRYSGESLTNRVHYLDTG